MPGHAHDRVFIIGITLFTLTSLVCGLASTQWFLIAARAVQGVGGALGLAFLVGAFFAAGAATLSAMLLRAR